MTRLTILVEGLTEEVFEDSVQGVVLQMPGFRLA